MPIIRISILISVAIESRPSETSHHSPPALLLMSILLLATACGATEPDDDNLRPPACEHVTTPPAKQLRVFAVGHKLQVSEGATYASYAAPRSGRRSSTRSSPTSRPIGRKRARVPESVAFTAAFVGAGRMTARAKDSAFLAYVALQGAMSDAFAHYRSLAPAGASVRGSCSPRPIDLAYVRSDILNHRDRRPIITSIDGGNTVITDPTRADRLGHVSRSCNP